MSYYPIAEANLFKILTREKAVERVEHVVVVQETCLQNKTFKEVGQYTQLAENDVKGKQLPMNQDSHIRCANDLFII